ncbi:MatE [Novymonas esmeraldas]|uniref:MatE n=1 Tax=Novymonas esmeraldas TaxID=1808958 RepID=A0AAW0FC90_9TRYP
MSHPSSPNTRRAARERADAALRTSSIGRVGAAPVFVAAVPPTRDGSVRRRHHAHEHRHYGTIPDNSTGSANVVVRSASMPVHFSRMVYVRKHPRQLTVGQQSARLAEKAKKNYFHGSFTSAHGAVFTVPNRAQMMATTRPSRATSMVRPAAAAQGSAPSRRPPPISLDVAPTTSALKKSAVSSPQTGSSSRDASYTASPGPRSELKFLDEPIVLPRRAMSADASIGGHHHHHHHLPEAACPAGKLHNSIASTDPSAPQPAKMTFGDSSPDLLALQTMRDNSATERQRQPLSPTTISRAARALRAFEERKVRMPSGSFSNAREVNYAGGVIPVPDHTPLVLAPKKDEEPPTATAPRRVHINSDAEENVVEEGSTGLGASQSGSFDSQDNLSWCGATMDLLYLAVPAAISICFTFSTSVVPLAFVGSYLGPRELTGASVGFFLISMLITYPMIGLTFALDTLCSHEYGRDPLSPEMGLVLQRGALINLIMLVPLCCCIYFLDGILVPLYGAALAKEAEEFLVYSPLFLTPLVLFIAMNKFLNNQMQPHLPMIALTAGVVVTPFLQMKLTPMGVRYTMVGMAITAWFQLIVVVVLTFAKPETRITLGKWRIAEALDWADVKEYMKLAIPSAIFVAAEASSFDVTVLMCARFGEMNGAAWSGIMNCLFIFASFSGGLSASACANIGRCVGAYEPVNAKRFVLVAIFSAVVLGLIDSVILVVFFDKLMALFGTQGKTLALAREVLFLLPVFHVSDAVQFTFQGIFSGMGKNYMGAVILLTSLWGVGVPLAFILGHYLGYRMFGVCVGITVGLCIEAPVMVYAASTMNYVAVCEKFMEDEEDEETEDSEESEESEEYDEEYVEEVMRRSGISISSTEVTEGNTEHYRKLLPPRRRGRQRTVVEYQDDDN